MLVQVLQEVGLGLELPGELGSVDLSQGPFLGVLVGLLLHVTIVWSIKVIIRTGDARTLNDRPTSGTVRERYLYECYDDQKSNSGELA